MFRTDYTDSVSSQLRTDLNSKLEQLMTGWISDIDSHNEILNTVINLQKKLTSNVTLRDYYVGMTSTLDQVFQDLKRFIDSSVTSYIEKEYLHDVPQAISERLKKLFILIPAEGLAQSLNDKYQSLLVIHEQEYIKDEIFLPSYATILFHVMSNGISDEMAAKEFTGAIFGLNYFERDSQALEHFKEQNCDRLAFTDANWDLIFDFIKFSQLKTQKRLLVKQMKEPHKILSIQNDLYSLYRRITVVKAAPDDQLTKAEIFLKKQLLSFNISTNIQSILSDPHDHVEQIATLNIIIDKDTNELNRYKLANYLDLRISNPPAKAILNKIKQALIQANFDYENANSKIISMYFFHHSNTGKINVASISTIVDRRDLTEIQRIIHVIDFLKRHEFKALGEYINQKTGYRGLRLHSFDSLFLKYLFNENTPTGLLGGGYYLSIFNEPVSTLENRIPAPSYQGQITAAIQGPQRLKQKRDRQIIRENVTRILFRISEKLEETIKPIEEYQLINPQIN